jgi:hypothetical protein
LTRIANLDPRNIYTFAFYVLAPESQIEAGIFDSNLNRQSIYQKVRRRVIEYKGERGKWFNEWFNPVLGSITISTISWEEVIRFIKGNNKTFGLQIENFYENCLKYNTPNKIL